ncbi:protein kinase domain-containing protein [Ilumatobacter sp.]|uniref:nSTAND1 domain-containing NTPase n=1 Tax=Ilumatobacter sp. TaxID=1967498 RepID=UPI003AF5A925
MQVSVLGPVRADRDGDDIRLGPRLQRLLAALVVHRGSIVSADTLADIVWDGTPPAGAEGTLRSYVTRLRQALGGADTIVFRNSGYELSLGDDQLDAHLFESGLDEARIALQTADREGAGLLLATAIERWSGPAFGELGDEEWARPERVRLEERHTEALETQVEVLLGGDRAESAIALARSLCERSPLRERPRELLMRAMYVSGRQAEAVRVYREYSELLGAETGLEPSHELGELEGRIIRGELARTAPIGKARGYELGECLGRGAFSVVHRAIQPGIGRDVAVKVIRAELADQPEFVRRFEYEAQLVAAIEHPHVVPLYDFWREPGAAYLVMRWMRGGSLDDVLRSRGPLSREQVRGVLEDIGGALHAAHRSGVVHRDVRPCNLLRDEDGATYLADFGIATNVAIETSDGMLHYAAPEVLRAEPAGVAADVLSLGVTVFELLTGRLPFADSAGRAELLRRQLGEPLPPVRSTRTDLPGELDDVLARATSKVCDDRYGSVPEFVDALVATLADGHESGRAQVIVAEPRNPYVGLHAFTEADADRFFGRDRLVGELLDAVEQHRLVVLVGPSGSGKSSVVRAGLIPALRRDGVAGSSSWFITTMFPGQEPIDAMEAALLRVAVNPPASLREQLGERGGLLRAVRRVVPDDDSVVLLVIDQFEELFTVVESEVARDRFLGELALAIEAPDSPLRVVATLRADHYDAPLRNPALAELVTDGTVTVRPMRPDELEQAIASPASSVGTEVELALVAELVAGVSDRPATLPLLQFSLTEVFERRADGTMQLAMHRELGGLTGALAARAERIVGRGDEDDTAIIRRVFSRLVSFGEAADSNGRRRAPLAEFGDDERTAWLIDEFVSARLLVVDRDDATREPTLEVAHEALLRDWPRLRTWIEEDRDDLRAQRSITTAAGEWEASGRDDGLLARGGRLELVSELEDRRPELLNAREREWMERSRAAAIAETALSARQQRRLRRLLTSVAVLLLFAVLAAGVAFVLRNRAADSQRAAEAREVVLQAENQLDADPELSALLAIESIGAFRAAGLDVPGSATDVLRAAMNDNRVIGRLPGGDWVDISADGSRLLTPTPDGGFAVWDVATMEQIDTVEMVGAGELQLLDVWFAGNELFALGGTTTYITPLRRTEAGAWEPIVDGLEVPHDAPSWFESDGRWFSAMADGDLRTWDIISAPAVVDQPAWTTDASPSATFDFSPDGRMTYVDSNGVVHVVESASGRSADRFDPSFGLEVSVRFSPDGNSVAVLEDLGPLTVYDLGSSEPRWAPVTVAGAGNVFWLDDGARLIVPGRAGIHEVDATSGETLSTIRTGGSLVYFVAAVPGSDQVFAASVGEPTIAVLDLSLRHDSGAIAVLDSPIDGIRYMEVTSDGSRLVALNLEDTAVVELVDGDVAYQTTGLPIGETSPVRDANWATAPVMSVDGSFVASPDLDGRSTLRSSLSPDAIYTAPDGWDIRAISSDGERVMIYRHRSLGAPDRGEIVDVRSEMTVATLDDVESVIRGYFTPDDGYVALYGGEFTVRIWDATTGEAIRRLDEDQLGFDGFFDVGSVEPAVLAASKVDGSFSVVALSAVISGGDLADAVLSQADGHETFLNPIVLSPDGSLVATVGNDEPVKVWDTSTGDLLATFAVSEPAASAAFHPTEPWVYIADGDTITVHTLDVDELLELAQAEVARAMAPAECQQYLRRDCG